MIPSHNSHPSESLMPRAFPHARARSEEEKKGQSPALEGKFPVTYRPVMIALLYVYVLYLRVYGKHAIVLVLKYLDESFAVGLDTDGLASALAGDLPAGYDVAVIARWQARLQLLLQVDAVLAVEGGEAEVATRECCCCYGRE